MKFVKRMWWLCLVIFISTAQAEVPSDFVDQYIYVNRTKSNENFEWNKEATVTIDGLLNYNPGEPIQFSQYGGISTTNYEAKGYFYTKKIKGRWWFVDPEGHLMLHIGLNSLKHGKDEFSPFANNAEWSSTILTYLKSIGIYSGGGWSSKESLNRAEEQMNYFEPGGFVQDFVVQLGYPKPDKAKDINVNPVFHPDWIAFVDAQVKDIAERYNGDPRFIGFFSDNELNLSKQVLKDCLNEAEGLNFDYAVAWVQNRRGNTEPVTVDNITEAEMVAFFRHYLEAYYKPIYQSSKKYMPNHLYVGTRVYQSALLLSRDFLEIYGAYVDVMSFNRYTSWSEPTYRMDSLTTWTDKPWIATEFYAKGSEFDYFQNVDGAGQVVEKQENRGQFYQNIVLSWLQHKSNAGWAWFGYRDPDYISDPTASVSNKGMFDLFHNPYEDLTKYVKQLNIQYIYLAEFFDKTKYNNTGETTIFSDFTANNRRVNINDVVTFKNDTIGNADKWSWVFEGGSPSTSTDKEPSVKYESAGYYNVKLISSNESEQDVQVKEGYIHVLDPNENEPPIISFSTPSNLSQYYVGSKIRIDTEVLDIDGSIDSVQFFVDGVKISTDKTDPFKANYIVDKVGDIQLKLIAFDNEGLTSEAVINIKGITDQEPPQVSIRVPVDGKLYLQGEKVNKISALATPGDAEISHVEFYANDEFLSSDNTVDANGEYQHFGFIIGQGKFDLTAIVTDVDGISTVSDIVSVYGQKTENVAPEVNVTSPADLAEIQVDQYVTLSADASDADGQIVNVNFLVNGVSVGVADAPPYEVRNYFSEVGSYKISAIATDDSGATTTSSDIQINVVASSGPSFSVELLDLADGDVFLQGTMLDKLEAIIVDQNGELITSDDFSVEFIKDAVSLKVDTSYRYRYFNVPVEYGPNVITVIAKDSKGNESTSTITVYGGVDGNQPPYEVNVIAPLDGAVRTVGELIKLEATALDSDSEIYKVEFFVNKVSVGVVYKPDYRIYRWPVPLGVSSITAIATDVEGATLESSPIVITGEEETLVTESDTANQSNGGSLGGGALLSLIIILFCRKFRV